MCERKELEHLNWGAIDQLSETFMYASALLSLSTIQVGLSTAQIALSTTRHSLSTTQISLSTTRSIINKKQSNYA